MLLELSGFTVLIQQREELSYQPARKHARRRPNPRQRDMNPAERLQICNLPPPQLLSVCPKVIRGGSRVGSTGDRMNTCVLEDDRTRNGSGSSAGLKEEMRNGFLEQLACRLINQICCRLSFNNQMTGLKRRHEHALSFSL